MQVKTKELEIPKEFMETEWQTNKVKIKKWTLGIRNEILDQTSEYTTRAGKSVDSKIKGGFIQILTIAKCTVEAPWSVGNVGVVNELDPQLGDWIYKEMSELNGGEASDAPKNSNPPLDVSLEAKK